MGGVEERGTCSTKEALSFALADRPLRLPPRFTSFRDEEEPSKNIGGKGGMQEYASRCKSISGGLKL